MRTGDLEINTRHYDENIILNVDQVKDEWYSGSDAQQLKDHLLDVIEEINRVLPEDS